ncbi:hypothetical protein CEXT_719631 [Caerostris extrusa]|uniref:Uncharacterized protein n=1 Tax=Caerostris extrusa TaxID=172846 RepID=A0AAV4VZD3_CAEEX|nr:hypothetical protein CEXT_719631 [Caerostris extrusa]
MELNGIESNRKHVSQIFCQRIVVALLCWTKRQTGIPVHISATDHSTPLDGHPIRFSSEAGPIHRRYNRCPQNKEIHCLVSNSPRFHRPLVDARARDQRIIWRGLKCSGITGGNGHRAPDSWGRCLGDYWPNRLFPDSGMVGIWHVLNISREYDGLKSFPHSNLCNAFPLFFRQDNRPEEEWKCSKHADIFSQLAIILSFSFQRNSYALQSSMHACSSHKSLVMKCPEDTVKVLYALWKHKFAEFSDSANQIYIF